MLGSTHAMGTHQPLAGRFVWQVTASHCVFWAPLARREQHLHAAPSCGSFMLGGTVHYAMDRPRPAPLPGGAPMTPSPDTAIPGPMAVWPKAGPALPLAWRPATGGAPTQQGYTCSATRPGLGASWARGGQSFRPPPCALGAMSELAGTPAKHDMSKGVGITSRAYVGRGEPWAERFGHLL